MLGVAGTRHVLMSEGYRWIAPISAFHIVGGCIEWAVAEAKGTKMSLKSTSSCPTEWSNQARNVVIKVNGTEIDIPRHVVVATRVNPNAKRDRARRLQVRTWNRAVTPQAGLPSVRPQ